MKKIILLVCILLFVTGCAIQRAQVATRAQTEMLGMSKKSLMMCAGVPVRKDHIEDLEFWTFTGGGDTTAIIGAGGNASGGGAVGALLHRYCEATVVLKQDVIQKISYAGRTGGLLTKGEQCAFIFENCIRQ